MLVSSSIALVFFYTRSLSEPELTVSEASKSLGSAYLHYHPTVEVIDMLHYAQLLHCDLFL